MTALARNLLLVFLLSFPFSTASSQSGDARIVEVVYESDAVYPITVSSGHATVVEFDRTEVVESVALGDTDTWVVETTANANSLVIKPTVNARATNMVVMTTDRTYAFTLNPYGQPETFVLRFRYLTGAAVSSEYRLRGTRSLRPEHISDNGRTTTILWGAESSFPAIFILDEEEQEIAPDYRPAGNGIVIDGVYDQFIFRSGRREASASRRATRGGD